MSNFGIGLSALQTAEKVIDMLSHNISNANTPGFKKLVEHNSEVMYGNQPGGVRTTITRSNDPFADYRLNSALGDAAESAAYNDGLHMLGDSISTKTVEETFSAFMNSSQDLNINPQDPARQAAFKEAGQTFSAALVGMGKKFDDVTANITYARDMTQIELDNLQSAMSQLTSGPATEETMNQLDSLTKEVMMRSRTIDGYNKVLRGVIPPVTSMFVSARDAVVAGSNASYGQPILDINGGFNFDANNVGNVKDLTEFGSQKFNKDMGVLNTTLGAKLNSSDILNGAAQGELASAQAASATSTEADMAEQAIKILRYQKMYEAATAVIKVQDGMLGTLLNIMG